MLYRIRIHQRGSDKHPLKKKRWLERELNGGRPKRHVLLMDAQIIPNEEEFALGMGQRSNVTAPKVAQINLRTEECVKSMEQRSNYAAVKAVQIQPNKEEFA